MNSPSPVDIDTITWSSITESSQKKHCIGARMLHQFVLGIEHIYSTQKKDDKTNIIDQGEKKTYALPNDILMNLFKHLNACRLENSITHFSEKQGDNTGFMLDLDIITTSKNILLTDRHFYRLTGALFVSLQRDLKFDTTQQYIFYTTRQNVDPVDNDKYKYGFHILIPGIRLEKIYRRWFLQKFKTDPALISILTELKAIEPENCLDQNSASVPVLFIGSCKAGGKPYNLSYGFEVWLEESVDNTWVSPPVIKPLNLKDIEEYNLVAELSLVTEAVYDSKQPLIKKCKYEYKSEIANILKEWSEPVQNTKSVPVDELLLSDHSLSTLAMHNPEAKYLHGLLDILTEDYYTDRNKWRNVIYALANTSEQYKTLAIWFSQKNPEKWLDNGQAVLDELWNDAINFKCNKPLTIASILHWAQTSNPERYNSIMERSYFTILTKYVYEHGGKLQHYMIAKILHIMLQNKFCVDVDTSTKKYCWYEFVLPGQPMKPGEAWKWRKEVEPDDIHIYISEKLINILEQISDHIEEKKETANSDSQAVYYKNLGKSFATSKNNLFNDTFKNGIIKQATYIFRKRGFVEQLDMLPNLFGVGNGVLELGKKCHLIDYYHENPVSKFTPIVWVPFDEKNKWTKLVLNAIADIIVEPDVRNWILFHACQGLSRDTKEGLLLLFEGGGQNGKTSFLRWVAKSLGPYADKFNIQLLACDREEADKPNSAMMKFKYINWAYAEESNKAQSLNVARMKELVNAGEVSGRDLNSKQETFTMKCNFVVASQYSFIVNTTDHGTWRRLKHYTSKTKFCANPDPNNPYEKKDNQDFNLKYSSDPNFLSSMLSILSHYYERLQNEYGGELKNVPCPTLDIETEAFRISQDAIHRWICESIVISPFNDTDYDIGTITNNYMDWYKIHIDRKAVITSNTFIKEIMSSAISKYLKPAPNKNVVLKGCRILTGSDISLREHEEYISVKESAIEYKKNYTCEMDWWNH